MGSTLSNHQADLLARHFDRAVLMLDGDEAGRQGARAIARTLAPRVAVTVIAIRDEGQPDQLPSEAIRGMLQVSGRTKGEGDDARELGRVPQFGSPARIALPDEGQHGDPTLSQMRRS
jgi:hypothetical protein